MTLIMRLVRSEMLEVLRTDYIKFARARGLTDRSIHFGHALKNTQILPVCVPRDLRRCGRNCRASRREGRQLCANADHHQQRVPTV